MLIAKINETIYISCIYKAQLQVEEEEDGEPKQIGNQFKRLNFNIWEKHVLKYL